MSSVKFNPSDLGDASSFKPNNYTKYVWIRPTGEGEYTSCHYPRAKQIGTNKDGEVVPLKDFDIYDMLSLFMRKKDLSILIEKSEKEEKRKKTKNK